MQTNNCKVLDVTHH